MLGLDQVLGGLLAFHAALAQALDHLVGDLDLAVELHPRAGRDQAAHDDVLLEAAQVVDLAADRGLGQHALRSHALRMRRFDAIYFSDEQGR